MLYYRGSDSLVKVRGIQCCFLRMLARASHQMHMACGLVLPLLLFRVCTLVAVMECKRGLSMQTIVCSKQLRQ